MKDFFKQGNPNGLFSWQHLLVCFVALSIMFTLGITLGIRDKKRGVTLHKNKVLMWAAIAIWFGELSKYIVVVVTIGWKGMLSELPLFLCSLQLFTLPLVCITKGKFQQAMADMIFVLGMVGAITGTILATEFNYNAAFSFFPLTCVFTHCVSGFACLYIGCANLFTMDKKTWLINTAILIVFSGCAWIGEIYLPADYMFLKSPDGTPFTILWNWFNGSKIFYPLSVIFVQLIFLALFYGAVNLIRFIVARKKQKVAVAETPINAPTNNDIK